MIYLAMAMPVEARAIIKKLNLKRDNSIKKVQVFKNEEVTLIITGVGTIKSLIATTHILSIEDIGKNDIFVNLGVCGAKDKEKFTIGDVVLANKIVDKNNDFTIYPDMIFAHNFKEGSIETHNKVVESTLGINEDIVDMEASGVLKGASYFFNNSQIFAIKIVSDYLDSKIEGEKVENLIEDRFDEIYSWILRVANFNQNNEIEFSQEEKRKIDETALKMKFSESMKNDFINYLEYLKICKEDIVGLLEKYEKLEIKDKREGKKILDEIRGKIVK